jgi:hypothetical protein
MNTHVLSLTSTGSTGGTITMPTVDMFDATELSLDLSEVYSNIFPDYVAINWGDNSEIEEPETTIYRDYKTQSIFPEIKRGASPVFFNELYKHIFYPSKTALKKEMTMRVNIGYINGTTTKFSIPLNVRTEGYFQTIEDLDLLNVSLLDSEDNNSIYTFLTKKDNFVIQNHDDTDVEYSDLPGTTLSSYNDTSNQSITEMQAYVSGVADPVGSAAKFRFIQSVTQASAVWTTTYWGFDNRAKINFSGTSYAADGFTDQNNVTLISPRHGISVSHAKPAHDPAVDDVVYFYDFTTGNSISATISATSEIPQRDLTVISFDRDLSTATTSTGAAGSLKLYKVPRFDNEVPTNKFPLINQGGNEFFDNDYYSGVAATGVINETKTSRGFNGEITTYISDKLDIFVKPPGLPDFRLTNVSPLLSSANLSLSGVASGDSGGPLFIPYNDELILLGIMQTRGGSGGTAKNFGNSDIQELISQGMEAVGNTWGYQLSTVRLS